MRQVEARGVTLGFSHTNPFAQLAFQKISVPDNPPNRSAFPDQREAGKWLKNTSFGLFALGI